jgi:hypothetical protein
LRCGCTNPAAAIHIDALVEAVANLHLARSDVGQESVELAQRLGRIFDDGLEAVVRTQQTRVADLAPAFAIEGRLVEDDLDLVAFGGAVHPLAVLDDRLHHALALVAE